MTTTSPRRATRIAQRADRAADYTRELSGLDNASPEFADLWRRAMDANAAHRAGLESLAGSALAPPASPSIAEAAQRVRNEAIEGLPPRGSLMGGACVGFRSLEVR